MSVTKAQVNADLSLGFETQRIEDVAGVNPRIDKSAISEDLLVSFVPMSAVGPGNGSINVQETRPAREVKKGFTSFLEGDVLFAKITPCMENGKMAVVPRLVNNYGFGSTEFHVLRPKPGMDAKYLYYYVSSRSFRSEAERYMSGAVGQRRVPTTYLKESKIPVAPPEQQKYIVAEIEKQFSRLDEAVANLKRIKANLKRYKASVLKAAVEGKLSEAWRKAHPDVEPASKLLERILTARRARWKGIGKYKEPAAPDPTVLPKLTKGWVWASLDHLTTQIADVDHKMPKTCEGGIPYVSTKDFTGDDDIDFAKAKRISTSDFEALCKKVRPVRGDILLSRYGTVGEVRIVSTDIAFQASYSVAILKPVAGFGSTNFVAGVLRSDIIQSQIKRDVRATAQPDLGLAHIRQFLIPLPPLEEQHQIIAEVERRMSILAELEATIEANLTRADRLRQSILGEAFSRELKISK